MRVSIRHEISHCPEPGLRIALVSLRATPRNHDGQYIVRWSLDVQPDCRLFSHEDAFGNLGHTFTIDHPGEEIIFSATGEVETQESAGVVRGSAERFPPTLFRRPTPLTEGSADINAFTQRVCADEKEDLGRLHALMNAISEEIPEVAADLETPVRSAAETLAAKSGSCADLTHLFTAAARHLGIPSRHISGYVAADAEHEGGARQWAEAYLPKIGWIAFDCGRSICATEAYVRLSVGLDSLGVTTLKGLGRTIRESVSVKQPASAPLGRQTQSQRQG